MDITAPGRYEVRTESSTYCIDADQMRAFRSRSATSKRLFTDGRPLVLAELPHVVIGEPMRLSVVVADDLLDQAHRGKPAPMVTAPVVAVARVG